jgi:hypothetical protein
MKIPTSVSIDSYETMSFLIVFVFGIVSSIVLRPIFWLFFVILIIDGLATLGHNDALIAIDRIGLGIIFLVGSLLLLNLTAVILILETLAVFVVLDLSFLARRLAFTAVEPGLIGRNARPYGLTIGGSLSVSYIAIYLYQSFSLSAGVTISALGVASAGVLAIVLLSVKALKIH